GDAFDDDVDAVGRLGHLADDAHRPDAPQVLRPRIVRVAFLQQHEQQSVAGERAIDGLDRNGSVDRERLQGQRKRYRAPEREDGKLGWKRGRWFGHAGADRIGPSGSSLSAGGAAESVPGLQILDASRERAERESEDVETVSRGAR